MGEPLYHEGNRQLQDRFDSRRIADRLEQVTLHNRFTDADRDFVSRTLFTRRGRSTRHLSLTGSGWTCSATRYRSQETPVRRNERSR